MTSALDTVVDPLVTPLLAFLKDAINADLSAETPPDSEPEAAVATTAPHPVDIEMTGETALPILTCYRTRSRARRRSIAFVDHTVTLQFTYVTAATAREQLGARWPLLERVWAALLLSLSTGSHPAHADGEDVLDSLRVIEVVLSTAQKREIFQPGGDYTYPAFVAEIDLIVQDDSLGDASTLYPALSFDGGIYLGDVTEDAPDVAARAYTPLGEQVRDGLVDEDELPLP